MNKQMISAMSCKGEDFAWIVPHVHSVCTLAARSPEDSISNFRNH